MMRSLLMPSNSLRSIWNLLYLSLLPQQTVKCFTLSYDHRDEIKYERGYCLRRVGLRRACHMSLDWERKFLAKPAGPLTAVIPGMYLCITVDTGAREQVYRCAR